MRDRLKNLLLRVLSAAVLGGIFIASLIWAGQLFDLLIAVFCLGAFYEWLRLVKTVRNPLITFTGIVYIALTPLILVLLRRTGPTGWHDVVFIFAVVWGTDTAAYIVGRLLGGPKLIPAISPNKTWSGAIGGLAVGPIAAAAASYLLLHVSLPVAALLGLVMALLTELGDLLESALKRRFQVKDSGWLIPGHGGILDRIDGLLLAAPCFALFRLLVGWQ